MALIYNDENETVQIDCSAALWASEEWHTLKNRLTNTLCDTDWIIEDEKCLILVEYKNACTKGAKNPDKFKPLAKIETFVSKYLDTLHYLNLLGKDKPRQYVCVLEYKGADAASNKMLRNKLAERLFAFRGEVWAKTKLVDSVAVLSIAEWNSHTEYSRFPILLIAEQTEATE